MVNKPLEARGYTGEAKRRDELLEEAIPRTKGGLLLITLPDLEAVEGSTDVNLSKLIYFSNRPEGLLNQR